MSGTAASRKAPPRSLATRRVEKVWGREQLPAPFASQAATSPARIGEIWFEPPPELPEILIKYLFTSEKLSVQVHPSSASAQQGEAGKEECWLVLDAEPDAELAIGFKDMVTASELKAAARNGSIEGLLAWHRAKVGDVFYLPAGTVHAIGPGLSLLEVQQNSDTTFRLYDYGRPRELHLDRAVAVADRGPHASDHRSCIAERGTTLIDGPHFRLERIAGAPHGPCREVFDRPLLALPLEGQIVAENGDAEQTPHPIAAGPGECLFAPTIAALDFSKSTLAILVCAQ